MTGSQKVGGSTPPGSTITTLYYPSLESLAGNMIGDNVQIIRKKRGLTQDKLARKADIPYATLTKLESNVVKKPSVQTVAKIAQALEVSIEELVRAQSQEL